MILVISYPGDVHARRVMGILVHAGQDVELFNYADFPARVDISVLIEGSAYSCTIDLPNGRRISSREITSVWSRRPKTPRLRRGVNSNKIRNYIRREAQEVLDSLPQMIGSFWLCHPRVVEKASHKANQLVLARRLGFNVPDTLFTNSETEVRRFLSAREHAAVKAIFSPSIELVSAGRKKVGFAMFTKRLSGAEVLVGIDQIGNCPLILEDYVEKQFELRITVVGDKVFACRMDTQRSEKTQQDFRNYDIENTPHSRYELPSDIESKCLAITQGLGLSFGCIDMIVDPQGEYHFLEINPNGQWLWTEELAGLPISATVADLLMNPPIL